MLKVISPPTSKTSRALTPKEQRFVEEYLVDLNGTQAYLRSHPGVKTTSASADSSKLRGKLSIQTALAKGRFSLVNTVLFRDLARYLEKYRVDCERG